MRSTAIRWPRTIQAAKKMQQDLSCNVEIIPLRKEPSLIAGVDASFDGNKIIAVACLFQYPEMRLIEKAYDIRNITFPYIPGYLSFREGPAIVEALRKLKKKPELIIFDGQGIAHPMRFGLASHLGVVLNVPSMGCAKSRLIGQFREPGTKKGNRSCLIFRDEQVGTVLRTRSNVKPIFVSPGHMIDFNDSARIALNCTGRYRIPEPTRCADRYSREVKSSSLNRDATVNPS